MARNIDVVNAFINGESKPKTKNLRIEGDKLFNYNTVIAERDCNGRILVNVTKYSRSTSTIQNMLMKELDMVGMSYAMFSDIKIGADSLV